jgi:hypothetical protein
LTLRILSYFNAVGRIQLQRRDAVGAWDILFWSGCAAGAAGALFALHRLALRLEDRGHLYYLNKKPRGSAAGCFVAMQRAIEPQIQHVIHVNAESRLHGEASGAGQGDPHETDAPRIDPDDVSDKR